MFKANDRLNYSSLPLTKLGTLPDFGFAKSRLAAISRFWLVRGLVDITANTSFSYSGFCSDGMARIFYIFSLQY